MARNPNRPSRRRRRDEDEPLGDEGALEGAASEPEDGTPAPDPLKHSSAEVEQARLAEAGAGRGESGDAEERDGDDAGGRAEASAALGRPEAGPALQPAPREGNRVITFLRNCVEELRRVQWPDRRQVGQATAVVLGFVVIAGSYLGLMDAIWKPVVEAII